LRSRLVLAGPIIGAAETKLVVLPLQQILQLGDSCEQDGGVLGADFRLKSSVGTNARAATESMRESSRSVSYKLYGGLIQEEINSRR
jgi:hypothetical protein